MIWDGSYQFCFTLIKQRPYFYLTRFHSYVLWLPLVGLSHMTSNLAILKLAYGLPFTLAPAASVMMSWWVVRKQAPRLIIWAILGAAAAPLPGQIFIINDSIFQQHMFWPVFLGLLVPLERKQIIALSLLAVFQFSHQIGLVLLAGGAGAAGVLALRDRENRRELLIKAGILGALAIVAFWKILHFFDSYAQSEFTWERARESWRWGVEGYPLRGIELMWAAGVFILLHQVLRGVRWEKVRRSISWAAMLCVLAAAANWTIWALDSHKWSTAVNYRRWVVPLTVPFYLLAFLDVWFSPGSHRRERVDGSSRDGMPCRIGWMTAATFALVLSIQSLVWRNLTRHLMRDVESYPQAVVPWSRINWTKDSPLYHWGTTSYVFVLEGKAPRKLVLDPDDSNAARQLEMVRGTPPKIPLSWFTPINPKPGPGEWFDFRPMLNQIRSSQ